MLRILSKARAMVGISFVRDLVGRPEKAGHFFTRNCCVNGITRRVNQSFGRPGKAVLRLTDGLGRPSYGLLTAWEGRPTETKRATQPSEWFVALGILSRYDYQAKCENALLASAMRCVCSRLFIAVPSLR